MPLSPIPATPRNNIQEGISGDFADVSLFSQLRTAHLLDAFFSFIFRSVTSYFGGTPMFRLFLLLLALTVPFSAGAADKPNYKDIVIASGASESAIFDMTTVTPGAGSLLGLFFPTAWTTANITFLVSPNCAAPWYNAYDDAGTEYTVAAGASRYVGLDPAYFVGVRCVKLRSGTLGSPVEQEASRTIRIGYGRF